MIELGLNHNTFCIHKRYFYIENENVKLNEYSLIMFKGRQCIINKIEKDKVHLQLVSVYTNDSIKIPI